MVKRTPLYAEHEALGASFTDFGGWEMPLRYGSELAEHRAVRETAGLFDLSHMGEFWVSGPDAATFLNTALVGNLAVVKVGRAKYSLMCTEQGGIIDDLIAYRISDDRYLVVPNAGNTPAVAAALSERAAGFDVEVADASADTSLIAVQGPAAEAILLSVVADGAQAAAIRELRFYAWDDIIIDGASILLARTGYTGEDGFELYLRNEDARRIWSRLSEAGQQHGMIPAGLAARDSLRLEAGMPLYGNELSLETNPFEVGLGPVVSFKKDEAFVGRAALEEARDQGTAQVLVGLKGLGRRAGRSGYAVHAPASEGAGTGADADAFGPGIGRITSGQPSPTLGYPIALALVDASFAQEGTRVLVNLRGKAEPSEVVALPFYTRQN